MTSPTGAAVSLTSPTSSNALYNIFKSSDAGGANTVNLTRIGATSLAGTRYVTGGTWLRQSGPPTALLTQLQAFTLGVRTSAADIPRTGVGSFGIVLTAQNGFGGSLTQVDGSGLFTTDFGTGRWTVAGTTNGRGALPAGSVPTLQLGVFSGSGALLGGDLGFDGKIFIGFPGNTNNEVVSGRFYGPGAAEVGASFGDRSLTGDSFFAGTFIGKRGTTAPVIETLSSLLGPGSVRFDQFSLRVDTSGAGLGLPPSVEFNGGFESRVALDPAAQTIDFESGFALGPTNKVAAESDTRFTVYRLSGTTPVTYRIYNAGAGNQELPLDFVSFALADRFGLSAIPFGLRSSFEHIPLSGRGTFDGVFYGDALSANSINSYALHGSASMVADFGALTIGGFFTASATNAGITTDLGRFDFANGRIGRFIAPTSIGRPDNFFSADISGAPGTIGSVYGSFYGPQVQELGATVRLVTPGPGTGVVLLGQGVIVAKRGPVDNTPAPPPPTLPPPPVNISLDPITVSDTFTASAQRASAVYPGNGTSPSPSGATSLTVRYDAATQSYTVAEGGGTATFAPGNRIGTGNRLFDLFQTSTGGSTDTLRLTPTGGRGAALTRYVAGGIWQRDVTVNGIQSVLMRSFTFGIPTASGDRPVSGTASFGVVLNGIWPTSLTGPSSQPSINGSGLLTIDWSTALISGDGITYSRSPLNPSGPLLLAPGRFEYRGFLAPTGLQGFLTLDTSGSTFSGTADGVIYGPGAKEIGLAYSVTSGTPIRSGVGVITGARGTDAPAFETLTSLLSDVSLSSYLGELQIPGAGLGAPAVGPIVQRSNVEVGASFDRFNISGSVAPSDIVTAESNSRFTTFRVTNSLGTTTTRVYRAGTSNSELALSYASLATYDFMPSTTNILVSGTQAFGLPTLASSLPRTGTGAYNSVVYGKGYVPGPLNDAYALRGTASLDFNWAAATFGGAMALTATNDRTGIAETLSSVAFVGGTLNRATAGFSSTLSGVAGTSGDVLGSFFGPIGQELGGSFRLITPITAGTLQAQGAIVGKRN